MSLVLCTIIHCLKHQVHNTCATLYKKSPNPYQVGFSFLWLWGRINQYHQYHTCVDNYIYIYMCCLAWKDNRTDAQHKPTSAGQLRGVAQKCKYHKISQDHVIMSFSQWLPPKQSHPVSSSHAMSSQQPIWKARDFEVERRRTSPEEVFQASGHWPWFPKRCRRRGQWLGYYLSGDEHPVAKI